MSEEFRKRKKHAVIRTRKRSPEPVTDNGCEEEEDDDDVEFCFDLFFISLLKVQLFTGRRNELGNNCWLSYFD